MTMQFLGLLIKFSTRALFILYTLQILSKIGLTIYSVLQESIHNLSFYAI